MQKDKGMRLTIEHQLQAYQLIHHLNSSITEPQQMINKLFEQEHEEKRKIKSSKVVICNRTGLMK